MDINTHTAELWNRTARADRLVELVERHNLLPRLRGGAVEAYRRCDRPGQATDADIALLTASIQAAGIRA
ncbi:MAG: hypothetical protein EBS90_13990 [Betaproteobacteria bacterium]|nr:hypothetical protein [Betaproteobacteria bacterium]